MTRKIMLAAGLFLLLAPWLQAQVPAKKTTATKVVAGKNLTDKPNIVVIMPDDVGYWNVGAYNNGMMVPTPNIDRIATEGMMFTDHYAAPSCTPGRAMFFTGQLPIRTGLTTVGTAGSPIGLSDKYPTLAELLKSQGYKTGQFGKNHLGDRNEHLPTVHGALFAMPIEDRNGR